MLVTAQMASGVAPVKAEYLIKTQPRGDGKVATVEQAALKADDAPKADDDPKALSVVADAGSSRTSAAGPQDAAPIQITCNDCL